MAFVSSDPGFGNDDYFDQGKFDRISKSAKDAKARGVDSKDFERLLNQSMSTGKRGEPSSISRLTEALDRSGPSNPVAKARYMAERRFK